MWTFFRRDCGPVAKGQLEDSLERGVLALLALQEADGGFPLLKWSASTRPVKAHSLFSTACILLSAGHLMPKDALTRACAFMSSDRESDGTWVFDSALEVPSDSDDTACVLAALAKFESNAVNSEDATVLRSFWREPSGPFQTWQPDNSRWNGPERDDPVVNGNVLLALKELGSPPSKEENAAAQRLIDASRNGSRYYCSPISISYAAVRAGIPLNTLPAQLTGKPKMRRDFLPVAQWLTMTNGIDTEAIKFLLSRQSLTGEWPGEAWITGIMKPKLFWGSSAVSSAFCLEAIGAALASFDLKK